MNDALKLVLTTKLGLTDKEAQMTMETSRKYAVWIANQLQANSPNGPLPGNFWCNMRKIMEWVRETQNVNLKDFTYQTALDAIEKAESTELFVIKEDSLKNQNVVAECTGTEFKWVELKTRKDCQEEGVAMKHCLKDNEGDGYRSPGARLFSLRNKSNKPVLTLQLVKENHSALYFIGQYSAKCNNTPSTDYAGLMLHLETQAKVQIKATSKYAHRVPVILTMTSFQEVLDEIISAYEDGDIDRRTGDTKIAHLLGEAKKFKLKVNVSLDLLDNHLAPPEEEQSFDDDGSLIC